MNIIAYQCQATINKTPVRNDLFKPPPLIDNLIFAGIDRGHIKPKLTQSYLKKKYIGWTGPSQISIILTSIMLKVCFVLLIDHHENTISSD